MSVTADHTQCAAIWQPDPDAAGSDLFVWKRAQ